MSKYLNNFEIFKIIIEIFATNTGIVLILHCNRSLNNNIHCGVMKFLADMPSCLGGEDNRINIA